MFGWKKIVFIILCTVLPILVAAGVAVKEAADNEYTLEVTLEGDREVYIEYGQKYVPQGASAKFWGTYLHTTPENVKVTESGTVNDRVLGTYTVEYTAVCRGMRTTVSRKVHVIDSVLPTISLVSDPEAYTLPGKPYQEEGYTATDNYDGDLTDRVETREEDGKVYYTVMDSAGNVAAAVREIYYNDPEPPVLTLKGGAHTAIVAGKPFQDPGYTAFDSCEGDVTEKVQISGSVDGYMPGEYTRTYTVTDNYGNSATATRKISVVPHPVQEYVENPEKVIYLTFDDGPGSGTNRLLDILKKYNVKATFFVVNTWYIDTIKRAHAEGHAIGVHSVTHNFHQIYASEGHFFADFEKMQKIIFDLTGVYPDILRFPGGGSNTISRFNPGIMTRLVAQVKEKGLRYFDWNVDSNDAGGATSASQVFNNVINGIGDKKMAVVLQHDIKGFSIDAVERIINWGLANGYTFLPLDASSPVCEHGIAN